SPASARTMNEMTKIVFAVGTLSHNAAGFLVISPNFNIDLRFGIEWRDHDVGGLAISFGMIMIARAFEANIPKLARQRSVADWRKSWIVHRSLLRKINSFRMQPFRLCACADAA